MNEDRRPGAAPPAPSRAERALHVLAASPVELELREGGELVERWPAKDASGAPLRYETTRAGQAALATGRTLTLDGRAFTLTAFTDVADLRAAQDELFKRAYFDEATGAPNRAFFDQAVQAAIGQSAEAEFSVAVLQIDRFAPITEYYGRGFGVALIRAIADRLTSALGQGDLLACAGEDRFLLMLPASGGAPDIQGRVSAIAANLRRPFAVEGHEVLVSPSIGVSAHPAHGAACVELRERAEDALRIARRSGKGAPAFFDPAAESSPRKSALHEQNLRQAIRDRRIIAAFQPKVDFRADTVVGLEVLMRWRDEDGALRSPGDLLGQAHLTGLIDDVTWLVLEDAIASLGAVDAAFGPDVAIGFNVSAAQAGDLRFLRKFADRLASSGSGPRFMIEITEEALVSASRFQSDVVPILRGVGAKISIDDFGVGFSSLSSLADITADELKVDRSFIVDVDRRPRSQSLLRAIESIGAALNMRVVVEGVETEEELAFLRRATGISVAQGYYFSKPIVLPKIRRGDALRAGEAVEAPRARSSSRLLEPVRRGGG